MGLRFEGAAEDDCGSTEELSGVERWGFDGTGAAEDDCDSTGAAEDDRAPTEELSYVGRCGFASKGRPRTTALRQKSFRELGDGPLDGVGKVDSYIEHL